MNVCQNQTKAQDALFFLLNDSNCQTQKVNKCQYVFIKQNFDEFVKSWMGGRSDPT